jgi:hypothetical protein
LPVNSTSPESCASVERNTALSAEDHAAVQKGLRALLEAEDDFRVVGEARTSREAERLASDRARSLRNAPRRPPKTRNPSS